MQLFRLALVGMLSCWASTALAQIEYPRPIDPARVTIARDSFGIPHIFAPTDPEAAYGMAWAHAEDHFDLLQEVLVMARGRSGEVNGKAGAMVDYYRAWIRTDELLDSIGTSTLSPEYLALLEAYCQGMNDYAVAHPKQVVLRGLLPVSPTDVLKGMLVTGTGMIGAPGALKAVIDGKPDDYIFNPIESAGSNGIAVNAPYTEDGSTMLVINPHLPYSGTFTFYECHLQTETGWNVTGGAFAGQATPGVGFNPNIGWMCTFNWPDFIDIYTLKLHPKDKYQYWFDGQWHLLERKKVPLRVKLGPIKLNIKREALWSPHHGPVYRNKQGTYALRFPRTELLRLGQQFYEFGRATNLEEFRQALELRGIPLFNIFYADREDNIFYQYNALLPRRNPAYNWQRTLPGDTSATVWTEYVSLNELPNYLNPECGYLFNCNNTPFHATCPADNLDPSMCSPTLGLFWNGENIRQHRLEELFDSIPHVNYQSLLGIKYDTQYSLNPNGGAMRIFSKIKALDPAKYPAQAKAIEHIRGWNLSCDTANRQAALSLVCMYNLLDIAFSDGVGALEVDQGFPNVPADKLEDYMIRAVAKGSAWMLRYHNGFDVPLSQVQRHQRGKVSLPIAGGVETVTPVFAKFNNDNGTLLPIAGDSYFGMVQWKDGKIIRSESVTPYGSSGHPNSPHYTDQMELFANQKMKPVELDREVILQKAVAVYQPGKAR